jgi:hypothetical protein
MDFERCDGHIVIGTTVHGNPLFTCAFLSSPLRSPHNFTSPHSTIKNKY